MSHDVAGDRSPTDTTDQAAEGRLPLIVGLTSIAVVLIVLAVVVITGGGSAGERGTVSATGGGTQTVEVSLVEMDIQPAEIVVTPGTRLILEVTNNGSMQHDLAFPDGPATRMLNPGESERLDLGAVRTSAEGWCTVPGHKAAGMTLDITVADADSAQSSANEGDADRSAHGHVRAEASEGEHATIDPAAEPGADFRPANAAVAPATHRREHHVTLRVTDQVIAVAPGVTQQMWTFGGTVPGPTLRGRVGDTFVVTLINDASMGHSIDFHASMLAPDRPMRTIAPGERLVYRFTAHHAGAWMYHCATDPMVQHVGNGMYGAVIIDPPDLPPVDAEYALVQSELYLGPEGGPGDFDAMVAGQPDAVVFNGFYDQYRHAPLRASAGDRVRIWVVNAGIERPSAFHVVGTQFDTVFNDGAYLVEPDNPAHGAAQVLALLPGQGGFVEFTIPEPGHYPFLSHVMTDMGRGAAGIIDAGRD